MSSQRAEFRPGGTQAPATPASPTKRCRESPRPSRSSPQRRLASRRLSISRCRNESKLRSKLPTSQLKSLLLIIKVVAGAATQQKLWCKVVISQHIRMVIYQHIRTRYVYMSFLAFCATGNSKISTGTYYEISTGTIADFFDFHWYISISSGTNQRLYQLYHP